MTSNRESQNKRLLAWLKKGRAIMPLMALHKLGIYRLSARCFDLRKQGYNIVCTMEYVGPVKFGRYKLVK